MHYFLACLFFVITFNAIALAEDNFLSGSSAMKDEAIRIADETRNFLATPVDRHNYGMIGTLAVIGVTGLTYAFDEDIRNEVQSWNSSTLDNAADVGNFFGTPLLHIGIAGVVYSGGLLADSPRCRETGLMLGEALFLADASTLVLKEAIGRERPSISSDKGRFNPFQFKTDSDSMPSMHTASSFAMASVMTTTTENVYYKLLYYSAAAFVGFSRIDRDKHWASDIVLGAVIGELSGRVVTHYHATHKNVALSPIAAGDGTGLALVGHW